MILYAAGGFVLGIVCVLMIANQLLAARFRKLAVDADRTREGIEKFADEYMDMKRPLGELPSDPRRIR